MKNSGIQGRRKENRVQVGTTGDKSQEHERQKEEERMRGRNCACSCGVAVQWSREAGGHILAPFPACLPSVLHETYDTNYN